MKWEQIADFDDEFMGFTLFKSATEYGCFYALNAYKFDDPKNKDESPLTFVKGYLNFIPNNHYNNGELK